jgi:1-acyl-sn-glycerol-3-phosphate acyltransferase
LIKKIISYPLSIIYYLIFGLCLLIFHPIQWLALKLGGYNPHRKTVALLNLCLTRCILILGGKITINNSHKIPKNAPLIFVSNHQSMNDIPPIIWFMRKYHPKFISKKELGSGIPSVSYNLRHGGSVLIDRKDPKQSLTAIINFAKYVEENNYAAVIFPEGTRSRNGVPKRFSENGLKMLVKYMPSAYLIPISINNSWEFLKYGGFPLDLGVHLKFDLHKPIEVKSMNFSDLFEKTEKTIKNGVALYTSKQ